MIEKIFPILILFNVLSYPSDELNPSDKIVDFWFNEDKDAIIKIFKQSGKFTGQIVWSEKAINNTNYSRDIKNPNPQLRSRAIIGLVILQDFIFKKKNRWKNGTIYDPNNGKTYKCNITANDDGTLNIRGYIGHPLFGRTTIWHPVPKEFEKRIKIK